MRVGSRTSVAAEKESCGADSHTSSSSESDVAFVTSRACHRQRALLADAPHVAKAARPAPCIVMTEPPTVGPAVTGERRVRLVGWRG